MIVDIDVRLHYTVSTPMDLLLHIEAAGTQEQDLLSASLDLPGANHVMHKTGDEDIGTRVFINTDRDFICRYKASVRVERPSRDLASLSATPLHDLPASAIRYLMPSCYCPSEVFQDFSQNMFGTLKGGAKIEAMREWVKNHIAYVPGSSSSFTNATDSFHSGQGVCRDFAHVLIVLARAAAIPARYASVYSSLANPPDFHAVVEVFLEGAWHLVDATGMSEPASTVIIGVGRDSADVAFLMSFGNIGYLDQSVKVAARQGQLDQQ